MALGIQMNFKVYFMERAEFWLCRRSNTEEHFLPVILRNIEQNTKYTSTRQRGKLKAF